MMQIGLLPLVSRTASRTSFFSVKTVPGIRYSSGLKQHFSFHNRYLPDTVILVSKQRFYSGDGGIDTHSKGLNLGVSGKQMSHPGDRDINGNTRLHRLLLQLPNFPCRGENSSELDQAIEEIEDPNIQNGEGWSYLHLAILRQRPDIVLKLLKAGADPTVKTKKGALPIDIALYRHNLGLLNLLKAHGTPLPDNFNPREFFPKMTNDLQKTLFPYDFRYWNHASCYEGSRLKRPGNPDNQMYSVFCAHKPSFLLTLQPDQKIREIIREIRQYFLLYDPSGVSTAGNFATPMGRAIVRSDIKSVEALAQAGYHPLIEDQILLAETSEHGKRAFGYCEAMRLGSLYDSNEKLHTICIGKPQIPVEFFKQAMNCLIAPGFSGISRASEFVRAILQEPIDGQAALVLLKSLEKDSSIDLPGFFHGIYRKREESAFAEKDPISHRPDFELLLDHAYKWRILQPAIVNHFTRYWQQRPVTEHLAIRSWLKDVTDKE